MKSSLILVLFFFPVLSFSVDYSITIDDPNHYSKPLFDPKERDLKILNHLKKRGAQAALFVCGKRIDSEDGKQIIQRWNDDGHLILNHSYSHLYYNNPKLTFEDFSKDILKGEKLIKGYTNFKKIFRFPYLKSGNTKQKRDSIRSFLKKNNYRYGHVTVDASDWYIADRLEKRLRENPKADLEGYKKYYLDHIWERAQYYEKLAKRVLDRSPKHTILIHHNLLNALFLGDLVEYLKSKGWNLISAKDTFSDRLFSYEPSIVPAGEGIIWAMAKEKGIKDLRYPAEDGKYEEDNMDRLGL